MILSNDQERVNPNQNKSLVYHTVMQQSSPDSLSISLKKNISMIYLTIKKEYIQTKTSLVNYNVTQQSSPDSLS